MGTYISAGPAGAPTIVLVHGIRLSRGMWQPQIAALSKSFRVTALDLPGHGSQADRPFEWEIAVDEIVRVIDEAAGGRTILVGLSLGGFLAMDVAGRHPSRVAGLVVSGATAEPKGFLDPAIRLLEATFDRLPAGALDAFDRSFFRFRYPPPTADAIVAGGFAHRRGSPALRQLAGRRFREDLARYPGPVMIVNGEFDLLFRIGQAAFAAAARQPRTITLTGAAHLANLDQPDAFSAAIARFAADVWSRPAENRPDDV